MLKTTYLFTFASLNIVFSSCQIQVFNKNVIIKNNTVFDFIVIGAGSAGSVVANRLSENRNWTVLLLEAGREENFFSDIPLMAAFQSSTDHNWNYQSEKSTSCCMSLKNQRCNIPRGKALGGTSVINFLIYSRGNKKDFDEWHSVENSGWSYEDVLPYFIKSENASLLTNFNKKYRGEKGPLTVMTTDFYTALRDTFINSGEKLGFNKIDPNGAYQIGFSEVQATMLDGRRSSTAKAYLSPILYRKNLFVVTEAVVTKILIDPITNSTYGITIIKNNQLYQLTVSKEVVLSAGSINSPQLLMLSGIGPQKDLNNLKIPVIKNLKVGYNLQDHAAFVNTFVINDSVSLSAFGIQIPFDVMNYLLRGKGPLTIPAGAESLAFLQTKFVNNTKKGVPDIELVFGASGFNNDLFGGLRNVFGLSDDLYNEIYQPIFLKAAFSITTVLLKPQSRGRVFIKSTNPLVPPKIQLNFFEKQRDLEVMLEGVKMTKKIGESKSFQRYNSKLYNFTIRRCRHLQFQLEKHQACLMKHLATTLGHQVGTCKMGPVEDSNSVVDHKLAIHGVRGLRVIDGSIMPSIVAGHTNAVIIMIGEKGSDLIKSRWNKK